MNVRLSSSIDRSSVMFSLVEHPLEITEPVPGNHCANVRISLESFNGRGENGTRSKFLGASHDDIVKLFVLGLVDDKLLNADAVLTSVLARQRSVEVHHYRKNREARTRCHASRY